MALRYLGLIGVVFVAVVWLLTNRVEPALLGLFGSMIGIGEGADAVRDLAESNRAATNAALKAAEDRESQT